MKKQVLAFLICLLLILPSCSEQMDSSNIAQENKTEAMTILPTPDVTLSALEENTNKRYATCQVQFKKVDPDAGLEVLKDLGPFERDFSFANSQEIPLYYNAAGNHLGFVGGGILFTRSNEELIKKDGLDQTFMDIMNVVDTTVNPDAGSAELSFMSKDEATQKSIEILERLGYKDLSLTEMTSGEYSPKQLQLYLLKFRQTINGLPYINSSGDDYVIPVSVGLVLSNEGVYLISGSEYLELARVNDDAKEIISEADALKISQKYAESILSTGRNGEVPYFKALASMELVYCSQDISILEVEQLGPKEVTIIPAYKVVVEYGHSGEQGEDARPQPVSVIINAHTGEIIA